MRVLVINAGSSSIKYALFEDLTLITRGKIEEIKDFGEAFTALEWRLWEMGVDLRKLDAIAHRVVHGGEKFRFTTLITPEVLEALRVVSHLAPLHNPANIKGIEVALALASSVKNYAVFDTAFHHTMPASSYLYAIDPAYCRNLGVRRYGFHGISHHFVSSEASKLLGKIEPNLITFHIGNGASVCAIKGGKSFDTSMGFTPLEGLVMGSRSGDLDPMIVGFLMRSLDLSIDELEQLLNKKSGLLALTGSSDMRKILTSDDGRATLALEIYSHRLRKYLGAYTALLNPLDAVVFTGGIGENSSHIRAMVLEDLEHIGIELDSSANEQNSTTISKLASRVKVLVIPTNEELQMAKYIKDVLENR